MLLKKPNTTLFFVLTMALLISSCSNINTAIDTSVGTAENTENPTIIPSNTPTSIPLPTETKFAPTKLPPIKVQCAGTSENTPKLDLGGVVALENASRTDDLEFGFYLMDLKNGNTVREVKDGMFTQISPDRKHIAYQYVKGDIGMLRLLNSIGETVIDFESGTGKLRVDYFNWQNSEQLRILHEGIGETLWARILNPFTQEYAPLRTDWYRVYAPKNTAENKLVHWKFDNHATEFGYIHGANIFYDPSLTRVLYPKDNNVVSLVDVENETEIASAQFEDWGKLPSWSPDGQFLSIVSREGNADEFYLISRDGGEFQKITNFSEELDVGSISEAVWSPDSKQIVFWLNAVPSELENGAQSELAILDIDSRQVTRLCIQGISKNAYEPWTINHPEPVWSPDGRYIMFTQWDDPAAPKNYNVLVIDTETGAVEKISENTAPIGWMVNGQ